MRSSVGRSTWLSRYAGRLLPLLRVHLRAEKLLQEIRAAESAKINIVYVFRRPTHLGVALLREYCRANDIPPPTSEIRPERPTLPLKPFCSVFPLRRRKGDELFLRHIRMHRARVVEKLGGMREIEIGSRTIFVPIAFYPGLGPRPFGHRSPVFDSAWLPIADLWRILVFWIHRRNITMDFGPAIEFGADASPAKMRHVLARELYRKDKLARGAGMRDAQSIENIVLSGEQFERALDQVAIATSSSRDQVYHQARKLLREIAATMDQGVIAFFRVILRPAIRRIFAGIEVHNLNEVRRAASEHPVVLLPSHRSHFDYLILSYVLYHAHLPLPYIAAGSNLNFFPVGMLLRASGAFFIRRKIEKDLLYKVVLDRYLTYLVKQGHMIEFYIEGGRSRTGLTLPPQLGLLKSLVRSFKRGDRQELMLVPAAVTYERLAEEQSFAREQSGKEKVKESVGQLLRASGILRRRLGPVVVSFGQPISLREFAARPLTKEVASSQTLSMLTEDLGFAVARGMARSGAITASGLASAALLSMPHYEAPIAVVVQRVVDLLTTIAVANGASRSELMQASQTNGSAEGLFRQTSMSSIVGSALERAPWNESLGDLVRDMGTDGFLFVGSEDSVSIPEAERIAKAFYRNTISQFLLTPALSSLDAIEPSAIHPLHQIFKAAFLLPHWSSWSAEAHAVRSLLIAQKLRTEEELSPTLAPVMMMLVPYIEALTVAIGLVSRMDTLLESEFLQRVEQELRAMPGSRTESQAQGVLVLTLRFLTREGLLGSTTVGSGRKRQKYVIVRRKHLAPDSCFGTADDLRAFAEVLERLRGTIAAHNERAFGTAADPVI